MELPPRRLMCVSGTILNVTGLRSLVSCVSDVGASREEADGDPVIELLGNGFLDADDVRQRNPHDRVRLKSHHRPPIAIDGCVDCCRAEPGAQHSVECGRCSTALHMAKDSDPRLKARPLADRGADQGAHTAKDLVTPLVDGAIGHVEGARDRLSTFGNDDDGGVPALVVTTLEPTAHLADVEWVFRHQRQRSAASDTGVRRHVTDMSTHHLDDHHSVVRFSRRVQPIDEVGRDLHRGVEAERLLCTCDVIVDGLRDPDHRCTELGGMICARERSVAPDDDQSIAAECVEIGNRVFQAARIHGGVAPRRSENGSSTRQRASQALDVERHVALLEHPCPSVEKSEDLDPVLTLGHPCHCTDHRVQTRTISPASEDSDTHLATVSRRRDGRRKRGNESDRAAALQSNAMSVVVAIDAGTTGVRSFAINESGTPVGIAYTEFPQYFPRPGWVEHDANEIWTAVEKTLAELIARLDEPIAAIGITDQRETVVAWSRSTGLPVHRAIVWQDRRTAARCDDLQAAGHLSTVRGTTGLVLDPYFSGTKAEWLLAEGGVDVTTDLALGTIDSWLVYKLTGGAEFVTDTSNASRTMLFDINTLAWSQEMCDLLGVPLSALAEVMPSSGRFGVTSADCPAGAGIPISGIAGDQQAALFGQACLSPGMVKNTYGTGSFIMMNVGDIPVPSPEGLLSTVAWTLSDNSTTYALEGSVFVSGAAIQWLRDGLGLIKEAAEIGPLASSVASSDGVYVVPAFTGLGSPYWDPYARGTIIGITRGTGRAELARAVVDSMAYQTRDVVDAMSAASGRVLSDLRVDGGASVMPLLLQLQADQIGIAVSRPVVTDSTALGSAFLAGLAEGVWASTSEVADAWQLDERFEPGPGRAAADSLYEGWTRAVERSRGWAGD